MTTPTPCALGCRTPSGHPREAAPGWRACHRCADRLAAHLADLEHLAATLDDPHELLPARTGDRGAPGYGPRSPAVDALLAHLDVRSQPTDEVPTPALAVLESWARQIREETSLDTPPQRMRTTVPAGRATLTREIATLRFHWHHVLAAEWLPDFADELHDVLDALRGTARLTQRVLRLGTCPIVVELMPADPYPVGEVVPIPCGTRLSVRAGDAEIRCRGCGSTWPRERWHQLGDPWADVATLSAELGVPVGTLYRWRHEDNWQVKDSPTGGRSRRLVARADALASYTRRRGTPAA